ncbi:hypothetical protein [Streptomyces vastus]
MTVRCTGWAAYGWAEPDGEHVKRELGWADFQARSGQAVQRH